LEYLMWIRRKMTSKGRADVTRKGRTRGGGPASQPFRVFHQRELALIVMQAMCRWGGPATRLVDGQGNIAPVAARPETKPGGRAAFLIFIQARAWA
jgi:hypothetical protein